MERWQASIKSYEELMAAKTKEVEALTKAVGRAARADEEGHQGGGSP